MYIEHVSGRRLAAELPGASLHLSLVYVLFVAYCLCPPSLALAAPASQSELKIGSELAPEEQRALAERFAPVLVFHPSEKYFPTSPLFLIQNDLPIAGGPQEREAALLRLGTTDDRRKRYEALTPREKAALATVHYRAFHARLDSDAVIVIEYWLYYVQNTYRIRGNLFPFWVDGSHPNDLEHIHVIVQSNGDSGLVLRETYSSAHTGTMPPNRHTYSKEETVERARFLVELGSHAIAPDVDEDGVFTPGADGSSGYKMQWGIRDRGITWTRYNSSYMDARTAPNSIVLDHAAVVGSSDLDWQSYRLVPVDELTSTFAELDLSKQDRQSIFETDRHWFRRMFGGDNGSSEKLLVPPARSKASESIGIEHFASTERGFLVGTQISEELQGLFLGARYAYMLGGTFVPDLMIEADAVIGPQQQYLATQFLVAYPIDGSTTIMVGKALLTDSLSFERHQWDWVGAIEFPVGHMRIYAAFHSWGPITRFSKEFRVSYFF